VGGVEQWRMVVEESFPRGGVTKWLDGDSMPITEASTCKSRNIQEMVLPVEGWRRQRWGGGIFSPWNHASNHCLLLLLIVFFVCVSCSNHVIPIIVQHVHNDQRCT
jgi:hypothetical protein